MKKYQSGEYCKAKCFYQKLVEDNEDNVLNKANKANPIDKEQIKKYHCSICEAKKFHKYLDENGYEIIKKL